MPLFSAISKERLATCDPRLQELFNDVIEFRDCSILVGHRGKAAQDLACAEGNSRAPWPTSNHNCSPSRAVDAAPYPIDWEDIERFKEFADYVKSRATALGIKIRWGGDYRTIKDYDHFELETENVTGPGNAVS